ncbi:MAG: hypothetical protein A3H93_02160 [Rhodocyclales bacterium RIFCSPLOWO2_02_FULL_63_24]|nr:MAG: hypothetical protein A3H93_02160 [Rhodocyclales bacterium RIFCSPLOWO2_02_FULL_63_24]
MMRCAPVARLLSRLAERLAARKPDRLDAAALKDIGISRADLPAIRAGVIFGDASRRPRWAERQP